MRWTPRPASPGDILPSVPHEAWPASELYSSRFGTTGSGRPRGALRTDPPEATIQVAIVLAGGPHTRVQEDTNVTLAERFGAGQVFWSMLWFFMWVIWFWLLVVVFGDIFRSDDLGGWGKALWSIFVIFLPYLGVFVYLIARGGKMHQSQAAAARARDTGTRACMCKASRAQVPRAAQTSLPVWPSYATRAS